MSKPYYNLPVLLRVGLNTQTVFLKLPKLGYAKVTNGSKVFFVQDSVTNRDRYGIGGNYERHDVTSYTNYLAAYGKTPFDTNLRVYNAANVPV